jgi:hypothetical protein
MKKAGTMFIKNLRYLCLVGVIAIGLMTIVGTGGGGGGGGGSTSTTTTGSGGTTNFAGGTLDELKALSPNLTFDHLEISGKLVLPHYSNETISVNSLTITSSGSIGYEYSTCEYVDAPSITIDASGEVIIEGSISLYGRSGTRVTSGATCNSCYGQDGGNVSISAETITVTGSINNYGGSGGTLVFSGYPSSGCSGGASGNTSLSATTIDLSGGTVNTRAGSGGYGGGGSGSNGAAGTVDLIATDLFKMISGSVYSSGELTLQAEQTEIYGPITYGTMTETIGGATDNTPPDVVIQSPQDNSAIQWGDSLAVTIQVSDSGTGVNNLQVTGFGYDETHSGTEVINGVLTITIPTVTTPASLSVTATDNKGNNATDSLAGLSMAYTQESEPNDSPSGAQVVDFPDIIEGKIKTGDAGTVTLLNYGSLGSANQTVEDWFKFTVDSYATRDITLDFSGSDSTTDIDLFLFDSSGATQLGQSYDDNPATGDYTESIRVNLNTGTYIIGIQAYIVASEENYTLTISSP